MEKKCFPKTINDFQPLTIFAKNLHGRCLIGPSNIPLNTYSWPYVSNCATDDAIAPAIAANIAGMP